MTLSALLRDFDPAAPETPQQPSADFQTGFEAGYAAAQAEAERKQNRLNDDLVIALSDLGFGYNEARRHIVRSLAPFMDALIGQMIPAMLGKAFAAHVVSALLDPADVAISAAIPVMVHPENVERLAAFAANAPLPLEIRADPQLGPNEARWIVNDQLTAFDLTPLAECVTNSIATIFDENERKAHG
ncbi:hypothetical protein HCZ30_02865 [Marivivens donghaensis]|uniref:Flagellar assembly protein FliH n=1 Tax=Marivivens donghaensis TaxID=1699413 RepID=A0ABX0VVW5_9RHOB|nr:hypothetical protein [Marivivens donghaensis]NIY71372.1 hypothetical protein [Marivivens donghaensis]